MMLQHLSLKLIAAILLYSQEIIYLTILILISLLEPVIYYFILALRDYHINTIRFSAGATPGNPAAAHI